MLFPPARLPLPPSLLPSRSLKDILVNYLLLGVVKFARESLSGSLFLSIFVLVCKIHDGKIQRMPTHGLPNTRKEHL